MKTRIRSMKAARAYVAAAVAAMLDADFDNASLWMLHADGDGNLAGMPSEELVKVAARELLAELYQRAGR